MEQGAPNHVIGTGSLEVQPQMQAVHEELDRLDRRLDELKAKAATVFAFEEQFTKAEELADRLKEKFAGINFDDALKRLDDGISGAVERLERVSTQPQHQPPIDGGREVDDARREEREEEHLRVVTAIQTTVNEILEQVTER